MNKQEYLQEIRRLLNDCEESFREEILNDFDEHFEQGKMKGRSEEEIAESLGDLSELIEELKAENQRRQEEKPKESAAAPQFHRVGIQGNSADVTLRMAEDDKLHYELNDTGSRINIHNYFVEESVCGDELILEVKQRVRKIFNFDFANLILSVALPKGYSFVSVQSISGDLKIKQITAGALVCKSTSGDIEIQDFEGNIKADTVSGEIKGTNINQGQIELSSTSGDIRLDKGNVSMIKAKTMSGDVKVMKMTCRLAQLSSMSGDVDFNGEAQNIEAGSTSGDIDVLCAGAEAAKLESVSGDVALNVPGCSGMECVLKTLSGDVDLALSLPYQYRKNYLTFGDQHSAVSLKSFSGDLKLKN